MGINNCNYCNQDTCPLPNSCQPKSIVYLANIDCDIAGYKQKCYLGSCEKHLKIISEIIKSRSTALNIKMTRNYQKKFGKSKKALEYQKSNRKLSQYVVRTTQTVSAAFYV